MNTPTKDTMHKELTGQRYVLVDALRGIAAFSVLCHHLLHNSQLQAVLWIILPAWFAAFCHYGAFGVQIFFVLSGFVIAHSLRNVQLSPGALGNFLLRRQLRLDPPYWTVLLITITTIAIERHFPWIVRKAMPGFTDVLKHLFYLQDITGLPDSVHILGVAWTLCLEVQFYLVLILLLVAGKYLGNSRVKAADMSLLLVVILGIISIALPKQVLEAWFIQYWYYFASGVVCYWSVRDRRYRFTFIGFLALILIGVTTKEPLRLLTGGGTALLLFTAGSMGGLTRWLNIPVLQYLGRISYSLYLIHLCVATYVLRYGYRKTGDSPAGALLWFVLAGALSIFAGHLLYITVERRSMQFASRFKPAGVAKENKPDASTAVLLSHCAPAAANEFQDA
jgi:peptidoglycan/LPS O-acetylase OafA/YrhL